MRIRLTRFPLAAAVVAVSLAAAAPDALAGSKDFVIYVTRIGGDPDMAKPYIEKFCAYLEETGGFAKGSVKGAFFIDRKKALDHISKTKPGFGLVEPTLYLELRGSEELTPFGQMVSKDLVSRKLHVVVKDPALDSLDKLKGKKLVTTYAGTPAYLSRVVFAGKIDAKAHFALQAVKVALKGVRAVLKGEAEATILDEDQLTEAKKIKGGEALHAVFTSGALPAIPVVFFGKNIQAADRKVVEKTLLGMCGSAKGGPICKEFRFEKIVPLDKKLFKTVEGLYEKP
jgi:hypothetical protein